MFRVPENTVLRRTALATLLALTTAVSACGGSDDPETASTTTPAAAAPAEPVSTTPVDISSVSDTEEGARAIAKASDKEISTSATNSKIDSIAAGLKAAGYTPTVSKAKSNSSGSVQVEQIAIVFYKSPKLAAQAGAQFAKVIASNGGHGRIARSKERLYLMNIPGTATAENKAEFKKVRKVADESL